MVGSCYIQARTQQLPTMSEYLEDEAWALEALRTRLKSSVALLTETVESYDGTVVGVFEGTPFVEVRLPLETLPDLAQEFDVARLLPKRDIGRKTQELRHAVLADDQTCWRENTAAWKATIADHSRKEGSGVRLAYVGPGAVHPMLETRYATIERDRRQSSYGEAVANAAMSIAAEDASDIGVAPDVELMFGWSRPSEIYVPAKWAVDNGADVILAAGHIKRPTLGREFEDLYLDWIGNNAPFPVIVRGGGEADSEEYRGTELPGSPALASYAYNALTVGGTDALGQRDWWSEASWLNPATPHMDRELPEIVAPAIGVSTSLICDIEGTHASAAMVAGAAAQVLEQRPDLHNWPEAVRAALLAGAHHNAEGQPVTNLGLEAGRDLRDGVGQLNVDASLLAARSRLSPTRNDNVMLGVEYGLFSKDDLEDNQIDSYRIVNSYGEARSVRIALSWSHAVDCAEGRDDLPDFGDLRGCGDDPLSADLDLMVYDVTTPQFSLVAYSMSRDNNYEVMDVLLHPGRRYRIDVDPHTPGALGDGDTKYGIALMNR